jgi:DNA anti-recombination protein RmuC
VLRTDVHSGFQDINEFIEEMGIQVQLLNTRLGEDGPALDYANTTIWEALEKLQNMATRVSHKVEGFDGQLEGLTKEIGKLCRQI